MFENGTQNIGSNLTVTSKCIKLFIMPSNISEHSYLILNYQESVFFEKKCEFRYLILSHLQ